MSAVCCKQEKFSLLGNQACESLGLGGNVVWALPSFKRVPLYAFPKSLDNLHENFRLHPAGKERAQGSQVVDLTHDCCSQMKQEQTWKDLVQGGKSQLHHTVHTGTSSHPSAEL